MSRFLVNFTRRFTRYYISFVVLLVIVTGLSVATWCYTAEEQPLSSISNSNVVVIVIDTLRADHLPLFGYSKDSAPFISRTFEQGIVFDRAFSPSSSTAPAMASIFTSLYPSQHGVITGQIATANLSRKHPELKLNRIPSSIDTLPKIFKRAGYRTFGVADNHNISESMGFSSGFDHFVSHRYQGAKAVNQVVRDWKDELNGGSKYFLYIHYMDPHRPYHKQDPWYQPADSIRQNLMNAYDSEISFVDKQLEELAAEFNWANSALMIFFSDHGEEFWEHGGESHGTTLYTEVTRVPFAIRHGDLPKIRVTENVSTLDLLPTLAEILGLKIDSSWRGKSLWSIIRGQSNKGRSIFTERLRPPEHNKPQIKSIIFDNWHLIAKVPKEAVRSHKLYNINDDFSEQKNQFALRPEIAQKQIAKLEAHESSPIEFDSQEVTIEVDEDYLQQLKSLGYFQ